MCESARLVHLEHLGYRWKPEEGAVIHSTEAADSCEPACGGGELNPGPLEEQSVLLTIYRAISPSLHLFFKFGFISRTKNL